MRTTFSRLLWLALIVFALTKLSSAQQSRNVELVGFCGGVFTDVFVEGSYAYCTVPTGLLVIDVSNPALPRQVGQVTLPGQAWGVYVSGGYAYVAAVGAGLRVIDVSNPAQPREVGYYYTPDYAAGVYVSGRYAYVADWGAGLRVIDVSNPAQPREVGYYDTPGWAYGVYVSGGYAYVADVGAGLLILRFGGENHPPSAPTLLSPPNGAVLTTTTPTFKVVGTDPDGDRVRYHILAWKQGDIRLFTTDWLPSGVVASKTVPQSQPLSKGLWYWRAFTEDEYGNRSGPNSPQQNDQTFLIQESNQPPEQGTPQREPSPESARVAWGPLVQVSNKPANWDSNIKRLVAGECDKNGVLYLAFSHPEQLSDALVVTRTKDGEIARVQLNWRGVYWVRASDVGSITPLALKDDTLRIPARMVVQRTSGAPEVASLRDILTSNGRISGDVQKFYSICLRAKEVIPGRPVGNRTLQEVKDELRALGERYCIPPHVLWAIAWQESPPARRWHHTQNDNWSTLTGDGGIGLMQLTSVVWAPRNPRDDELNKASIPGDLLTHLLKAAADWRYNVLVGTAILLTKRYLGSSGDWLSIGPGDGTSKDKIGVIISPYFIEHWWFAVWGYNGYSCSLYTFCSKSNDTCPNEDNGVPNGEPGGQGCKLTYPEIIWRWLAYPKCYGNSQLPSDSFPPVGTDGFATMGFPQFMRSIAPCSTNYRVVPTPFPANADVDFDGVIDLRVSGYRSPDNLVHNNNLYFYIDELSGAWLVQDVLLEGCSLTGFRSGNRVTVQANSQCGQGVTAGTITIRVLRSDSDWLTIDLQIRFDASQQYAARLLRGSIVLGDYKGKMPSQVQFEIRIVGDDTVYVATADVSPYGYFEVGVPAEEFEISLKAGHWLRQTLRFGASSQDIEDVVFVLTNGDANGDNRVDEEDISAVLYHWGEAGGGADLNGDGKVDNDDLQIVFQNMGKEGAPSPLVVLMVLGVLVGADRRIGIRRQG